MIGLKFVSESDLFILVFFYSILSVTGALRESLLFDFGSSLMARDSLWLFGIDYLEHSSIEGKIIAIQFKSVFLKMQFLSGVGAIELLLPKIPVSSERQAMKIIAVAKRKGLTEVGELVITFHHANT